jgi:hypothetical protein
MFTELSAATKVGARRLVDLELEVGVGAVAGLVRGPDSAVRLRDKQIREG